MLHKLYELGLRVQNSDDLGLLKMKVPKMVTISFSKNLSTYNISVSKDAKREMFIVCSKKNVTRDSILKINIEKIEKLFQLGRSSKDYKEFREYCQSKNAPEVIIEYINAIENFAKTETVCNFSKYSDYMFEFVYSDGITVVGSQDIKLLSLADDYQLSKNPGMKKKFSDFSGKFEDVTVTYEKMDTANLFSSNKGNAGDYSSDDNFLIGIQEQKTLVRGFQKLRKSKHHIIRCSSEAEILIWKEPTEEIDDFGEVEIKNISFDSQSVFPESINNPENFFFIKISNKIAQGRWRVLDSGKFNFLEYANRRRIVYNASGKDSQFCKNISAVFPLVTEWFINGHDSNKIAFVNKLKKSIWLHPKDTYGYILNHDGKSLRVNYDKLNILKEMDGKMKNVNTDSVDFYYGKLLSIAAGLEEWHVNTKGNRRPSKFRNLVMWKNMTKGIIEIENVMSRYNIRLPKYISALADLKNRIPADCNSSMSVDMDSCVLGYIHGIDKIDKPTEATITKTSI